MNRSPRIRPESADPFAMQLALSRVHARLVPMERGEQGYTLDPSAAGWLELPAGRGLAGYGLGRALRMLLDVLRGLTALHDTFDTEGVNFAHGEVALTQFRVDSEGVCRLVPLTERHSSSAESTPPPEALGYLAPERLLGEHVDARADVFSAGVLLWEALAGRRLFSETTADAIIERLMGEKLPMPQLPPELAWAIPLKSIAARALAVDPYQRFVDCAELATAIAIVARERVATHVEITAFFGSKLSSSNSVAKPRPVPSRSSTFPSVSLPTPAPASVSAPPSSRNGFPLATPGPRPVTPGPGPVTLGPRPITLGPRSVTPGPRSITPAPLATLRDSVVPRDPVSQRNATHKSPFATLLGTGESMPASHRRKTLTSVGTPPSVIDPLDTGLASASLAMSTPPLPVWAASMPISVAPASQAPTSSSAVVARATLESLSTEDVVATLRPWSSRRSLIVLALLAIAGLIALFTLASGSETTNTGTNREPNQAQAASPRSVTPSAPAPQPAATSDEQALRPPVSPSASDPSNGPPTNTAKELRPASKAAAPKPASNTKDYGI